MPEEEETRACEPSRREILWMRAELERALVRLVDAEARIAERDAALAALRRSTSWRITRPVRALGRLMSRGPRRS